MAAALAFPLPGAAAPSLVAAFDDPAGDDTGPGTYVAPGDTEFRPGDFDLRRFAVLVDGADVLLQVTLGAPIRRPSVTARTNSTELALDAGIYLQNIDVYVDTAPDDATGSDACIPGRRVAFAGGHRWKAAVVMTPQPGAAREIAAEALGPAAGRVHFAGRLAVEGRTVTARVPIAFFGAAPSRAWAWSVQVSGATWERTFSLQPRLLGGEEQNAFTMPVVGVREAWAFGGAPKGDAHPRVVDVLLPAGVDQKAVLGSFDAKASAWARVGFVVAGAAGPEVVPPLSSPPAAAGDAAGTVASAPQAGALPPALRPSPPAPAAPGAVTGGAWVVADVAGDVVTVSGPAAGLAPLRLGRVLAGDGGTLARVVVLHVVEGGLVARVLEARGKIERGAQVSFAPEPPGGR